MSYQSQAMKAFRIEAKQKRRHHRPRHLGTLRGLGMPSERVTVATSTLRGASSFLPEATWRTLPEPPDN